MSALQYLNEKAEVVKKAQALAVNASAAKGLQEVLKSNLGPKGTIKMLVGGAGQIKLTKDGSTLLGEMQIQHPTASMIGRAANAQDDIVGDGTTTNVLFIGELMRKAEAYLNDGLHPRILVDGIESAKIETLKFLEAFKEVRTVDRDLLIDVAKSSLETKIHPRLAEQMAGIVTDAVLTIQKENDIDLHMVEIMHMKHKMSTDTSLVQGLVLDHGARHPDMPKKLKNCFILTCNVSLEYEKTDVHSGFFWSSAEQREKLIASERAFTNERVQKILDLKRELCEGNDKSFVVINQKGIDPESLDMMAKEGIIGIRRAKRRNMERLTLACGGHAMNSVDELSVDDLGFAKLVYEQVIGEDKFTFVEGVVNPFSCTILIKGPNEHSIAQVKGALRDGLRAVKNTIHDGCVVPGAGAFEIAASENLKEHMKTVQGKAKFGVDVFAEALLTIPRTLANNGGYDAQEVVLDCVDKYLETKKPFGIDLNTGKPSPSNVTNVFDNYCVKRQFLNISPILCQQLLLVDEVMRAGKGMKPQESEMQ
jgi:T-complex protein 1 subunit zeta